MLAPVLGKRRFEQRRARTLEAIHGLGLPAEQHEQAVAQIKAQQPPRRRFGALGPNVEQSQTVAFAALAPGALAALATIAYTTTGGIWQIDIQISLSGTAETQLSNLRLRYNDLVTGTSTLLILPSVTGPDVRLSIPRLYNKGGIWSLETVNPATAGAIYTVVMTMVRIA